MIKVKVATSNTRGFLRNLFECPDVNIKFHYNKENLYEVSGKRRFTLAKVIKWPIFDILGVFQVVKTGEVAEDVCFSYNRFLKTNKPYVIFLENPSALVNYCWERPNYLIGRLRLKKLFDDENLKGIICMSQACYQYIDNLYEIPKYLNVEQIYPYVPDDMSFTSTDINKVVNKNVLECIFISSDFELKGGRDVLTVLKRLEQENIPIHVTFITRKESIQKDDLNELNDMKSATVVEFKLSKEELDEYYKNAAILLNPTRCDSFSLVTLEAMKYGCAILATDIYAIKEMDIDNYNGFLTKSMIKQWDEDGTMNKYYRKHKKTLLYSGSIDKFLVEWMYEKLRLFVNDRDLLESMCNNSLKLARGSEFSANKVMRKWEKIFNDAILRDM